MSAGPPVAMDGEFDTFWRFRELLLRRDDLREAYDALERSFDGQSMAAHRVAKSAFFDHVRAEPAFASARLPSPPFSDEQLALDPSSAARGP